MLDLEQIKAQGRGVIHGWGQELAHEKERALAAEREAERQREHERSLKRGLERDGLDYDHEL